MERNPCKKTVLPFFCHVMRGKTSRSQRVSPIPPRRSPRRCSPRETFRRSAVCTVEQHSEEKRRRFTPCRHFGAGSLTDRHVFRRPSILYAPIYSLARQFVALFIPQQQLFCPMPHCFRKQTNLYRPAYPLPVILPIPLLLNPGNGVAALTDAFVHQRLSVSGASAPTTQPILQENYLLGKTFRLPYPQRVWSGLSNPSTTFQQTFHGISTSATAGAKGIASPSVRAKRSKTSFHWKWTPWHFKQNGSLPVYRTNVRQAAKNPSAHRRKQSLSFRKQTIPPPLHAVCNHFTVAPLWKVRTSTQPGKKSGGSRCSLSASRPVGI